MLRELYLDQAAKGKCHIIFHPFIGISIHITVGGPIGFCCHGGSIDSHGEEQGEEAVVTHVCNASASEIIPSTEPVMGIIGMIRHIGYGSQPKLPVKAVRHGLGFFGPGGPLFPNRPVRPVVYLL